MLGRSTLALAMSLGLAAAQGPSEADVHCDGSRAPNWDGCGEIISWIDWAGMGQLSWDGQDSSQACQIWFDGAREINCKLGYCFNSAGEYTGWVLPFAFAAIDSRCSGFNAGGWVRHDPGQAEVFNDPSAVVPGPGRRDAEVIPSMIKVSQEEYDVIMSEDGTIPEEKYKRQDNGFHLTFTAFSVPKSNNRDQVSPRLPAESSWTYQKSEGFSHSVATSVGADAGLFSIFTASVSIETTITESYEVTTGVDVNVDCAQGQQGIIYYEPLYDYYEGYYDDSPDRTDDFWIPKSNGGGFSDGQFVSECLG